MAVSDFRVRGRVGAGDDGKFYFVVFLTPFGVDIDEDRDLVGEFGPFDTEKKAHEELRLAAKRVCEFIEKRITGDDKVSGYAHDMLADGKKKSWNEILKTT